MEACKRLFHRDAVISALPSSEANAAFAETVLPRRFGVACRTPPPTPSRATLAAERSGAGFEPVEAPEQRSSGADSGEKAAADRAACVTDGRRIESQNGFPIARAGARRE